MGRLRAGDFWKYLQEVAMHVTLVSQARLRDAAGCVQFLRWLGRQAAGALGALQLSSAVNWEQLVPLPLIATLVVFVNCFATTLD